jgi:NAD-dependent deacetylase
MSLPRAIEAGLDAVAAEIGRAQRILFVTGAGISADSGLPTYRGVGGLYDSGATEDGMPIEEALSGPVFARRPEITWKYLLQIERGCRGARPNAAHEAIARLERGREAVRVLTQNVDGLHVAAGSSDVVEIHGSLRRLVCLRHGHRYDVDDYSALGLSPRCAQCGGAIRPEVVLFGEALPERELERLEAWMAGGFDLVFSIGTSSLFPYITAPILQAKARGVPTVEINPGATPLSDLVDHAIRLRAAEAMQALEARVPGR